MKYKKTAIAKATSHRFVLIPVPLNKLLSVVVAVFVGGLGVFFLQASWAASNPNLKGDLNNDNVVNLSDLSILLSSYRQPSTDNDLNGDGTITIADLSILLSNYGKSTTVSPPPVTGNVVRVNSAPQLTSALSAAKPGDVIILADGTYSGRFNSTKSGTANAPITVTGSRKAIIDGGSTGNGYTFSIGTPNSSTATSYWRLIGFSLTGGQKGVIFDNVQRSVIDSLLVQNTGQEGIHLRNFSSNNTIQNSTVTKTGQVNQQYGEGLYVGTAQSNWSSYSQGKPDLSNNNQLIGNMISFTGAENIDIKEATHNGVIRGNQLDGSGMCYSSGGCNFADSLIDMKGEGWTVANNTAKNVHTGWSGAENDGFQVHVISQGASEGSGNNNTFEGNTVSNVGGYGFNIQSKATGTVVKCDNKVTSAGMGFGNVACK